MERFLATPFLRVAAGGPASLYEAFAILVRCHAPRTPESTAEVGGMAVTEFVSNLGDGVLGVQQLPAGMLDAALLVISHWAPARVLLKDAAEVVRCKTVAGCQIRLGELRARQDAEFNLLDGLLDVRPYRDKDVVPLLLGVAAGQYRHELEQARLQKEKERGALGAFTGQLLQFYEALLKDLGSNVPLGNPKTVYGTVQGRRQKQRRQDCVGENVCKIVHKPVLQIGTVDNMHPS